MQKTGTLQDHNPKAFFDFSNNGMAIMIFLSKFFFS